MNSKGDISALKVLIIALIVLLLLLIPTNLLQQYFSSQTKVLACQSSILKAHLSQQVLPSTIGTAGKIATDLLNTRLGTLKCNDLPATEINRKDVIVGNHINDDGVKAKIADAMISCWKMVGKGELDPYKYYEGDQTYCLTCSDVVFDADFIQKAKDQNYQLKDFIPWIATHNPSGLKETYFELLYGIKPDTKMIDSLKGQEVPINYAEQYSLVWRMDSQKKTLVPVLLAAGVGTVAGAFAGSYVKMPVTGAAAGFVGAMYLSDKIYPNKVLSTGIYFVPKRYLGLRNIQFSIADPGRESGQEPESKPFCTQLVNY